MLVQQFLLNPRLIRVELERMEVHERDFFQHNGVVNRLVRVLAP